MRYVVWGDTKTIARGLRAHLEIRSDSESAFSRSTRREDVEARDEILTALRDV